MDLQDRSEGLWVFFSVRQSTVSMNLHNLLYTLHYHETLWVQTVESKSHSSVERDIVHHFCGEIKDHTEDITYCHNSMIKLNHNVTERLVGHVTGELALWDTPLMCAVFPPCCWSFSTCISHVLHRYYESGEIVSVWLRVCPGWWHLWSLVLVWLYSQWLPYTLQK